jgi:hypothetical protein
MSRRARRALLASTAALAVLAFAVAIRAHTGAGTPAFDACGGHTDKRGGYHCHKKGCEACHAKELAAAGPKAAEVQIVAFPGGEIFLDGKQVGYDATGPMKLKPGSHEIVVKNRFLGQETRSIDVSEGQTGKIVVNW